MKTPYVDPRQFDDEPILSRYAVGFEEQAEQNRKKIEEHSFANLYQSGLKITIVKKEDMKKKR